MPEDAVNTEELSVDVRNVYEDNHAKITAAFKAFALEHKKVPTQAQLAKLTELHPDTIYRHFKNYSFKDRKEKFKALTDDVIIALYTMATVDKIPRAAELYMRYVEGIGDKTTITIKPEDEVTGFEYVKPEDDIEEAKVIEG